VRWLVGWRALLILADLSNKEFMQVAESGWARRRANVMLQRMRVIHLLDQYV